MYNNFYKHHTGHYYGQHEQQTYEKIMLFEMQLFHTT